VLQPSYLLQRLQDPPNCVHYYLTQIVIPEFSLPLVTEVVSLLHILEKNILAFLSSPHTSLILTGQPGFSHSMNNA
jgi:hypothetical protein